MRLFVTGGAGFIGSNFCDHALKNGHTVQAYDDLSTGRMAFLASASSARNFSLVKGDIRDFEATAAAVKAFAPDWVIHLAANADVRFGTERPRRDLDYNTIGTWNVLEAARLAQCQRVFFSSTGSVYGEPEVFPTPENAPFPEQTSLYGASKAAGEALISAYCHGYGFTGVVFRFVSILGPRYTHGHVYDFVKQLRANPQELKILGDGSQTKSYLHVQDLMEGIFLALNSKNVQAGHQPGFSVFNIGHDDALTVNHSIDVITQRLGLQPQRVYAGGKRGWIGDSPRIQLDTSKLKRLGWEAGFSLRQSVEDTVDFLINHPDLFE